MKRKTITAMIIALVSGGAYAGSDFVDTAQVVSATPIIERVADTRQECQPAPAPQKSAANVVAPIIGGVLGGLLGHQVGQGSGQTAATIVGATGGAVAGAAVANHAQQPGQQCRTVQSTREVVNGYNVVYRYNGRDVNIALPYNPGSTVKVGVGIVLDERAADAGREPYARDRDRDRDAYRGAEQVNSVDSGAAGGNGGYTYRY